MINVHYYYYCCCWCRWLHVRCRGARPSACHGRRRWGWTSPSPSCLCTGSGDPPALTAGTRARATSSWTSPTTTPWRSGRSARKGSRSWPSTPPCGSSCTRSWGWGCLLPTRTLFCRGSTAVRRVSSAWRRTLWWHTNCELSSQVDGFKLLVLQSS